jgi:hypothetical protein
LVEITSGLWGTIINLATVITAPVVLVNLGLTVYQLHKNNQTLKSNNEQQRESNRMRELEFVNATYQQILSTEERLFYELMKRGNDKKLDPHELSFLFNRIEFLCFLINQELVKERVLLDFFEFEIKRWYDDWFVRYLPDEIVNDDKTSAYPSFRYRYNLSV